VSGTKKNKKNQIKK